MHPNFEDYASLEPIELILNEAKLALKEKNRKISDSSLNPSIIASVNAGVASSLSFTGLFALSQSELLNPSLLAVGLASLPAIAVGKISSDLVKHTNLENFKTKKRELLRKCNRCVIDLKNVLIATKDEERIAYINTLMVMLNSAIKDLKMDIKKY